MFAGVTAVYVAANPYSRLSDGIGFQDELQAARLNPSINQIR